MTQEEMLALLDRNVTRQGTQGAMDITPLLLGMIDQLFRDPVTGVVPIVVKIGNNPTIEGTKTSYDIVTPQTMLNAYIDSANETKEKTRLFVEDNGALIAFTQIEISDVDITGKTITRDGESVLVISKNPGGSYYYHENIVEAIPEVTKGEIDAYKMLFNAIYDKVEKQYMFRVGATLFGLTPAEMIIVNEEYNKTSTDANYTALWANSIAKYIICAKWFEGFHGFNLHSAFFNAKNAILIDLNAEMLDVTNLTNTFAGCSRLEQIAGIIDAGQCNLTQGAFQGCTTLQVFHLHSLATNLDLSDCPMLTYNTFEEMITYATMQRIRLYVHPDVKTKIDTNPNWADVRNAIQGRTNITVDVK